MPTIEPVHLTDRLEQMAAALVRQRAEPALGAFDAVDLRMAAREIGRLRDEIEGLKAENRRLRGAILDELAEVTAIGRGLRVEEYGPGDLS